MLVLITNLCVNVRDRNNQHSGRQDKTEISLVGRVKIKANKAKRVSEKKNADFMSDSVKSEGSHRPFTECDIV